MSMKTVTFRIPEEDRQKLEKTLKKMGVSQTELFLNTARYVIQNQKLPFEVYQQVFTPADFSKKLYDLLEYALVELDLLHTKYYSYNVTPSVLDLNRVINSIQGYIYLCRGIIHQIKNSITDAEYDAFNMAFNTGSLVDVQLQCNIIQGKFTPRDDLKAFMDWGLKDFEAALDVLQLANKARQTANDFGVPASKMKKT